MSPRPCRQPRLRGQQKSLPAGEAYRESSQHVERVSEGLQGCSRVVRFFRQKDSLLCIFSFSSLLHPFFLQFYLIKIHLSTGCRLLWTGHALSLKAPTSLALPPAPVEKSPSRCSAYFRPTSPCGLIFEEAVPAFSSLSAFFLILPSSVHCFVKTPWPLYLS